MSEQLFLEAFNSEPYFFQKEEKYGAMDIIYTFEDEAGHGFKFHFEKKVALGKHAYVCVLSQKTPGLKTYKRIIGKFSNPMRTVATLLAVVRDIHATRKDVHGIVMSIPEQAFGSYARLVKKIMTRELRTVLNVEDGEYTPEDFEKMGLVGIVTTVKPRNMNTVYTGPALKEYQERQAAKGGAPAAVVPAAKESNIVLAAKASINKTGSKIIFEPENRAQVIDISNLKGKLQALASKYKSVTPHVEMSGIGFTAKNVLENLKAANELTADLQKEGYVIKVTAEDALSSIGFKLSELKVKFSLTGVDASNAKLTYTENGGESLKLLALSMGWSAIGGNGSYSLMSYKGDIEELRSSLKEHGAEEKAPVSKDLGDVGVSLTYSSDLANLEVNGNTEHGATIKSLVNAHLGALGNISGIGGKFLARVDRENEQQLFVSIKSLVEELTSLGANVVQNSNVKDAIYKAKMAAAKQSDALRVAKQQAVKKPDFLPPVEVEFNVQTPGGRTLTIKVGRYQSFSTKDLDGNFVSGENVFKPGKIDAITTAMREYTNVAKMIPIIQSVLTDGYTVASVPQYRGKFASKGITNLNKPDGPVDLPKQTSVAQTMPAQGDAKEPYYFDYDHRQITLTFDNAEIAGLIKDQLLELGAATFNGNEFFTDKEKLILLDGESLDVKKVQATLFPILGQPVSMNGVNLDPNVRSSVRSPDGVVYHIKGNTIQVEDAPKDSAMTIIRELLPMADRIFDDKGSNTLELNSQGIADGFSIDNIAPVLKKSNLAKRLSAKLFRSWENAVSEASDKYELSTGDFGSSFTNNSSYLIDIATSGVVGEYSHTAGNVISGIVLKSNYKIREAVAKPLVALGFTVEYDVQGWRTQVKLPVNSDYTIPGTSELAIFIKEVDNLANIARNRTVEEFVGGNKNFRAKWHPDTSRAFLVLPTTESSGLAWRDYTAYATDPQYIRVDDIESYEQFLKLVEFVKNFDFGANLLRNIGVSKYLSDVRSGGAKASKSYKLKDGGEVEISFKFGDKVTFIFNQNSEGFDKEMSEFMSEKMEIFGRASAIPLYMLGTADANKTLKNIDAWLDAHIVSKEDNSSKTEFKYGDKVIINNARSYNSMATSDKVEGVVELVSGGRVYVKVGTGQSIVDPKDLQKVVGVSSTQNATNPIAAKPEKAKQSGTLEIVASIATSNENHYIIVQDGVLTTKSAYGSPRTEGFWRFSPKGMTFSQGEELVKTEIMKLYNSGASNLVIKAKVNEWLKPRGGYVIDVRGDRTNRGVKDIKKNLISTLEKLKTEGESKKLTGVDLRAGVTRAYNGQTGRVEKLYSVEGQAEQISELYEQLSSAIAFSGMKGKFEVEFWNPDKRGSTKHKVSFTEGGAVIPSSMLSEMGNYVRVTQSGINLTVAKDFDTSPEAVANEFMSYVGISNWHYNIKKKDIKQALYLTFDINAIKAIGSVEVSSLNESAQIDEGIKEDLTGKAPNRVKRELLEATLQKLGLYRESFTYGNATFKTVMSECAVEIIPTSGNIRNFAKMLGARLGQELRIDDEGFLSFDLDNI